MKRAVLVTAGTAAGLASVLAYSPPGSAGALAEAPAGTAMGLGGPPAAAAEPSSPTPTRPTAGPRPKAQAAKTGATPSPSPKPTAGKKSAASGGATPKPAPTPKPPTSKPPPTAPKPTPSKPSPSPKPVSTTTDVIGSSVTYKYGTLQAAIRVKDGKIVDAWAVSYPTGDSLPYSEMAIPILRSQTIAAQSAQIAGATGASLTSAAWTKSVAAALAKVGR